MAVEEEWEKIRTVESRNFKVLACNRLDGCMWPASFCDLPVDLDKESNVRRIQSLKSRSAHFSDIEWAPIHDMIVQLNSWDHHKKMTTTREKNEEEEDSDRDVDLPVDLGKRSNVRRLQSSGIWSVTLLNIEWVAIHDMLLERQSFN